MEICAIARQHEYSLPQCHDGWGALRPHLLGVWHGMRCQHPPDLPNLLGAPPAPVARTTAPPPQCLLIGAIAFQSPLSQDATLTLPGIICGAKADALQ